jgi:flavin-dependent dehydrogenase
MVDDVAIAGAGPAGSLAAIILARAGLRVRLFDRARFPRHKLCGDTLNPGALAVVQRHLDVSHLIANSDAIDGMILTGPRGVTVRATYGEGVAGRAITRDMLDHWLVRQALDAGVAFEEHVTVKGAATADGRIAGLTVANGQGRATHRARLVIAADGRRSNIAIGRGLSHQPPRPRRWAIGSYFSGVNGLTALGEMHVRRGHYIGVAPVPGGLANACLVIPHAAGDEPIDAPAEVLRRYLNDDPHLAPRFAGAQAVTAPTTLGPMAVEARTAGEPGLLLAGDAAGFIDPMTGDGLHFALRGAELAAEVAIDVLSGRMPIDRAHLELARQRRAAFGGKWRFNRAVRSLVSSPRGVSGAAVAAAIAPALFKGLIRYAGDCGTGIREPGAGNHRIPDPGSRLPT